MTLNRFLNCLTAENVRGFFVWILFISIPFSIAGDEFAIFGLYLVTIYLFIRRAESWRTVPIMYPILIMMAAALVSSLFSDKILLSLTHFRNFWRLGLPFLLFFALRKRIPDRYIKVFAVISAIIAVYAVIQYFTGLSLFRSAAWKKEYHPIGGVWYAVGRFSHHLTYGGVSLMLFSLLTPHIFIRGQSRSGRIIFVLGSVGNLVAMIVCMGRSIWLGAIVSIGIMIIFFLGWKRLLIVVGVLAVLLGSFTGYQAAHKWRFFRKTPIGQRISSYSPADNIDRLLMWQAAVETLKDHPILGIGPKRRELMNPYYQRLSKKYHHQFQHSPTVGVHNIYLQTWIDYGLFGLIAYLVWWFMLMGQMIGKMKSNASDRNVRLRLLGCLAGMAGIMIAGIFENNFRDGEVQATVLTVMGLALVWLYQKPEKGID